MHPAISPPLDDLISGRDSENPAVNNWFLMFAVCNTSLSLKDPSLFWYQMRQTGLVYFTKILLVLRQTLLKCFCALQLPSSSMSFRNSYSFITYLSLWQMMSLVAVNGHIGKRCSLFVKGEALFWGFHKQCQISEVLLRFLCKEINSLVI